MSDIKLLLKQSSHYLGGQTLVLLAGLISFPILTRIFSVSEYGLLGLVNITVFLVLSISKLGIPNSSVRFYSEFKANKNLSGFHSTLFLSALILGLTSALLFYLFIRLFSSPFSEEGLVSFALLIAILIFTGCINDTLMSFLRAAQRTRLYNLLMVIRRYGTLAISIFLVFFLVKGLPGFFCGGAIWGLVLFSFLTYLLFRNHTIKFKYYSFQFFKESIKFGFPLVWAELGHLLLTYADRYLIQFYLGAASLGIYTAGYNLTMHITDVIKYPINYAMTPIYMDILVNKGEEATKIFFSRIFRFFLLIIIPVSLGFIAVGKDLIAVLASSKYVDAYSIIPYIIIGQLVYGCQIILNSGLFIRKKTHIVTGVMISSCILNIGLNIWLIPRYGITGAAQATLVSYIFYTLVITYFSFKEFSFPIKYAHILFYLGAATVMYVVISAIDTGGSLSNLIVKIPTGIIIYASLILAFDKDIRNALHKIVKKLRNNLPK